MARLSSHHDGLSTGCTDQQFAGSLMDGAPKPIEAAGTSSAPAPGLAVAKARAKASSEVHESFGFQRVPEAVG